MKQMCYQKSKIACPTKEITFFQNFHQITIENNEEKGTESEMAIGTEIRHEQLMIIGKKVEAKSRATYADVLKNSKMSENVKNGKMSKNIKNNKMSKNIMTQKKNGIVTKNVMTQNMSPSTKVIKNRCFTVSGKNELKNV